MSTCIATNKQRETYRLEPSLSQNTEHVHEVHRPRGVVICETQYVDSIYWVSHGRREKTDLLRVLSRSWGYLS